MPYYTWSELFDPGEHQLATIADIKKQLRQAGVLTQSSNPSNQDIALANYMAICAADMKERVELRFQDKFPEEVSYYIGLYQRTIRNWNSQTNPFPSFGYISTIGNFIDYDSKSGLSDDPQVFLSLGNPGSRFNGAAYNGAFCVDITPSGELVYINKGTKDANSWIQFLDSDLPDYIANPSVLTRAFIYGTIHFLFEDVTTEITANNQIVSMDLYQRQEDRYEKKYETLMNRALGLLNVDTANGGKITSMDLRAQKKQWGIV